MENISIILAKAKVNALQFLEDIKPDILITNGGGMAYYKDKKIYNCEFSIEEVKQAAGQVCASNENDGVAKWIKENLL